MRVGHTVAASSIAGLLGYARAIGLATGGVLEAAGLSERSLQGPEARVPEAANNAVWAALAAASGDACFGLHFAERAKIDAFDVVGHIFARSPTVGHAIERVVSYSRILHDAGRVEVEERGDKVVVFPGCRGLLGEFPRHIAEFSAASVLVLARAATGERVVASAVRFRHSPPALLAEHLRVFGVAPQFDCAETEVELDAQVLALKIKDPQPGVLTYLDAYARAVLEKLPQERDLVSIVERAVTVAMNHGAPDVESIAAQLGMSARTLQRRLAEHETAFQEIVDGVRRQYAERYLADDRLALGEVAFLVGFSEPSNFHRAFRRWTGMTPAEFRGLHGHQGRPSARPAPPNDGA
jgi:AraC-like DNA-binding protein